MATANRPLFSGWPETMNRKLAATVALMQNYAGHAEARMKSRAPWMDRTAHARQGLHAGVEIGKTPVTTHIWLYLSHSMEYGKWLETVNGAAMGNRAAMSADELARKENIGTYAVIHPTADTIGPQMRLGVMRIWGSPGGIS